MFLSVLANAEKIGENSSFVKALIHHYVPNRRFVGAIMRWSLSLFSPLCFRVSVNGGKERNGFEEAVKGTYNWLFADVSKDLYNASAHTFETSHKVFRGAFEDGFPWEVLEVFSGPPKVAFTWRHWGTFTGTYEEQKGSGEVIEMYGFLIATVNDELKIQKLEVFVKTDGFLEALQGTLDPKELARGKDFIGSGCPFMQSQNE